MALVLLAATVLGSQAGAEAFRTFDGHGGPVKALTLDPGSDTLLSASFDNAVGVWAVGDERPAVWLDGHEAAVNAVIALGAGRVASGGDDFAVMIWEVDGRRPLHRLTSHTGKVMGLAATPDGARLASASWDGTVRLWDTATGAELGVFGGHEGPVNDVVWSADGARVYSAGYDGTVLEWDAGDLTLIRRLAAHGFGVNVLALNEDAGWLAYGALDGGTRVLDLATGETLADLTAGRRPILALAASEDGGRVAVGDGEGYIMVVDTARWGVIRDFRAALNGPVWALAFTEDGTGVIAGGIANEAYLWPLDGADSAPRMAEAAREFHVDPDAVPNGERQFLRKCSICHTLGEDGERRAGPALAGLFGREAGSYPGYIYSDAVRDSGIVWTEKTIDELFDIGPDHYIPGTKMPVQRIAKPEDRADLIDFLKRETRQQGETPE